MNHLLLIGIDKYPHITPPGNILTTCVKDVIDLKYVLLEKYYFEKERIVELINNQATNINIQKSLEKYISILDENSNLIIYFSGHGGLRKSTNKGYWIPSDADEEDYTKWLPNETILEIIKKIKAKHVFIITDCCFATSLLITNPSKDIRKVSLDNYMSRWVLTSGREETYCGEMGNNSFFGESLIRFLGNSIEDLRVGTIIEYIKEKFKLDELQQPQGAPLLDKNHDCGEFIFKIKDNKKLFETEIKGYDLFKKVIEIYSKSHNIEEIENFEDRNNKIGFTLLRENDTVKKEVTHYLYLYNEINQVRTFSYIHENYRNILGRNTIIFIPKEINQVFYERRLSNIEKLFSPRNIFYIDEFINKLSSELLKKEDAGKYLNINNFILPDYIVANNREKIDIDKWFNTIDSPILIVKGTAGIGKTTYAKYISDFYQALHKNNNKGNVIYIDSNEVKDELLYLQKLGKKIDLYNLYKAATVKDVSLDKELFSINIDAGNILLIIDGLDEIISRNLSFDIDYFFNSINLSNVGLKNCKIVITTRTYFWDKSNIDYDFIYSIELMPFDLTRAKNFFQKSFKKDENKIRKALSVSEDFKLPSEENTYYYHPFVLDIIKEIVESNNEILFNDKIFTSKTLNSQIKIDYIIGRICEREINRIQQIEVDKQIDIFIHLSVKEHGKFAEALMKEYLIESLCLKDISLNIIESFKSHPFLFFNNENRTLSFKYDFFENYFTSLYISRLLDISRDVEIDFNTIKILSLKLNYDSDTIKNITKRIPEWNENNLLKISDIIQKIKESNINDFNIIKGAISGIFKLALAINFKFLSNNRDSNTKLIKDVFSTSNNLIENIVITNLDSLEERIRFDFSDLTFSNCIIDNYNQFWECNLKENTFFIKCVLRNIGISQKEIHIPRENFIDCDDDDSLYRAFLIREGGEGDRLINAANFLNDFFKMFYKHGRFKHISENKLSESHNYPKINRYKIKLKEVIAILMEDDFLLKIEDQSYNEIKIGVKYEHSETVLKFCFESKQTTSLLKVIEKISEKI